MSASNLAPVHTTVIGVFDDIAAARRAVEQLQRAQFVDAQILLYCPGLPIAGCHRGTSAPEDVEWYESELRAGRSIVAVHEADERAEDARSTLRDSGGTIHEPSDIGTYGSGLPATPY
jgi:hypothetical protein